MKYNIERRLVEIDAYKPIEGVLPVRLDANESFFSMSEEMIKEFGKGLKEIEFNRYPDPYSKDICNKFAKYHNISSDCVVAGNGSDELINLIIQSFLKDGDKILTFSPDFSMYSFYANLRRAEVVKIETPYDSAVDIDLVIGAIKEISPRIIMFSNPCNPTGQVICQKDILKLCAASPDCLVVVDEAYMDFSDQSVIRYVEEISNMIILRTMSKAFAAASIRLGFAISNKELSMVIKKVKAPYNVNSVTQKFASILLDHLPENERKVKEIVQMRDLLYVSLKKYESNSCPVFRVFKSAANFVYLETDRAKEIYERLLDAGVAIRFFPNGTLRITAGNNYEQIKLFKELDAILLINS